MLTTLQEHVRRDILHAPPTLPVDITALVDELEFLEQRKVLCDTTLDHQEDKIQRRVYHDFMTAKQPQQGSAVASKREEELEDKTQQEMEVWRQAWQDHEMRLMDTISMLRDQLGEAGFQIHDYYHDKFPNQLSSSSDFDSDNNDNNNNNDMDEPEWKRRADKIVDGRIKKEQRECRPVPMFGPDDYKDVEELATLSDDEATHRRPDAYKKDSRWSMAGVTQQLLEEAWNHEERLLADTRHPNNNSSVVVTIRRITDEQDQKSRKESSLLLGSRDKELAVRERHESKQQETASRMGPRNGTRLSSTGSSPARDSSGEGSRAGSSDGCSNRVD